MVAAGAKSCLASSCRISHFGIKPVRGGRPPRDRSTRGVRVVITGALVHETASVLMFKALLSLNVRKVENVIMK